MSVEYVEKAAWAPGPPSTWTGRVNHGVAGNKGAETYSFKDGGADPQGAASSMRDRSGSPKVSAE